MGERPEVIDLKDWIVIDLTEEKLATLQEAIEAIWENWYFNRQKRHCTNTTINTTEKKHADPEDWGVDSFDGDPVLLRTEFETLPGHEQLHVQPPEYHNFWETCGIGWCCYYDPTDQDLKSLKDIREKNGFVIDRIADDRYVYVG